jgi:hypothetical protein
MAKRPPGIEQLFEERTVTLKKEAHFFGDGESEVIVGDIKDLAKAVSAIGGRLLEEHGLTTLAAIVASNGSVKIKTKLLQQTSGFSFTKFRHHFDPEGTLANLLLQELGRLR